MDNLKVVGYFANASEAGMAQELLENNGVPAVLQGGNFAALEPLRLPGGFSEIRLMVATPDYNRARELYEAFFGQAAALDADVALVADERPAEDGAPEASVTPADLPALAVAETTEALVVSTTTATRAQAEQLAYTLVAEQLAACVQISAPLHSFYRWQGEIKQAEEYLLLIKTTAAVYPQLAVALKAQHPYDTPEILALPVAAGDADYLAWLRAAVAAD